MPIMFNPGYIGPKPPCCDTDLTDANQSPNAECGPCPGPRTPCGGCGGGRNDGCFPAPEETQSPPPEECKGCNNSEKAKCPEKPEPPAAQADPGEGWP